VKPKIRSSSLFAKVSQARHRPGQFIFRGSGNCWYERAAMNPSLLSLLKTAGQIFHCQKLLWSSEPFSSIFDLFDEPRFLASSMGLFLFGKK
jgi:hypothetical protein